MLETLQGMLEPTGGRVTVVILGGSPVVGKALESLLRSADYGVRFFSEHLAESADPPVDARVALVMPSLSIERSEALITRVRSASATADLPIIELSTSPNGQNGQRIHVPWPCSVEVLKQRIEASLSNGSGTVG
jgi:hypothetical protein